MKHASIVKRFTVQVECQTTTTEYEDAIGQPGQLGQLSRAEQDHAALLGEAADEQVDLALGTDIDTTR